MPNIRQQLQVNAPIQKVFELISKPEGIDVWWSRKSGGEPGLSNLYHLDFGPGYAWKAKVTVYAPPDAFELTLTETDPDWQDTKAGFRLEKSGEATTVHFYHTGWPKANDHYHISCYCWAMYLRIMKRYAEYGETVPYEKRLEV